MARTTAEESEKVRQSILRQTAHEIANVGYAGLRVPNVAKRIGKTQGAIYARYPNKEALALAAVRALRDEHLMPRVMSAMTEADTALAQVSALSRALAVAAVEDPIGSLMVARIATELAGQDHALALEVKALFGSFRQILENLFEMAKEAGELHPSLDPKMLASATVGLPIAFATMSVTFGEASYDELEATLAGVLDRGVVK